jgi:L-threonylcarbamoyladenylate synthase
VARVLTLGDPPAAGVLAEAGEAIRAGLPVVVPTDTVYGLAVDPNLPGASDRVFEAKQRPRDVELPVLVADVDQALSLSAAVPEVARRLMDRLWPGALTLVLPRRPDLEADLGEDDATVGVRCPAHPVPRLLCLRHGPLATTSANVHGEPTPATAPEVAEVFGDGVALVLDGGRCSGSPSTVVDCTGVEAKLLRQGRIPWEEILAATKPG